MMPTSHSLPSISSWWRRIRMWLLLVAGSLVLIEITGGLALMLCGPRVYTNAAGTYAQELWYSEGDESATKTPPTMVTPYLVQIDSAGRRANLFIRYAEGNGSIYSVFGDAKLVSPHGQTLWKTEFDGLTEDLGPGVFTCAFADLYRDGCYEVCYRIAENEENYSENDFSDLRVELGHMHIERLNGQGVPVVPQGWQARWRARIIEVKLGVAMWGFFDHFWVVVLAMLPFWTVVVLLGIIWEQHNPKNASESESNK